MDVKTFGQIIKMSQFKLFRCFLMKWGRDMFMSSSLARFIWIFRGRSPFVTANGYKELVYIAASFRRLLHLCK